MFKIKNYQKFKFLNSGLCIFLMMFVSQISSAHEMWIQPLNYSVNVGKKIFANEIVGKNFKGNSYSYLDSSYKNLNITANGKTKAVNSRLGDLPAIQEDTLQEGLHIITAETTSSGLVYDTAERFETFLKLEGLNWALKAHKKRGLPDKGFKEIYFRNPKTLVKVGRGQGSDKAFGMPLEWVVETNPYTTSGNIKARLLWQGKPATNMFVNIFNKPNRTSPTKDLIKTSLMTDATGRIVIPRANGGLFMINSVKMIEPSKQTAKETGAVWVTYWGSLSYEIITKP